MVAGYDRGWRAPSIVDCQSTQGRGAKTWIIEQSMQLSRELFVFYSYEHRQCGEPERKFDVLRPEDCVQLPDGGFITKGHGESQCLIANIDVSASRKLGKHGWPGLGHLNLTATFEC